jgi:ribosomal protein RSM22 (predicted rRNA methylase)
MRKAGAADVSRPDARLEALERLRLLEAEGAGLSQEEAQRIVDSAWDVTDASPVWGRWARLVRNPKKGRGHVVLDMCMPEGVLAKGVVSKKRAKVTPGRYKAATKAQWGGLWPADM